jgi:hypothetical protein
MDDQYGQAQGGSGSPVLLAVLIIIIIIIIIAIYMASRARGRPSTAPGDDPGIAEPKDAVETFLFNDLNDRSKKLEFVQVYRKYGLSHLMQWVKERRFLVNVFLGLQPLDLTAMNKVYTAAHPLDLALQNGESLNAAQLQLVTAFRADKAIVEAKLPVMNLIYTEWLRWVAGVTFKQDTAFTLSFTPVQMERHDEFVSWWLKQHKVPYPQLSAGLQAQLSAGLQAQLGAAPQ